MTTWIDLAGWTLLHSLWQGALVWAATAAALRAAASAPLRYAIACCGLAALLAAPVVTAWTLTAGDTGRLAAPVLSTVNHPARADVQTAPIAASIGSVVSIPDAATTTATAARPDPAPPVNGRSIMPLVVAIWLCGLAVMLARLACGCWRLGRLRRAVVVAPMSRWQAAADALARRLGLRRPVLIVDSDRVDTPTVIGWLRPVVVLPIAAMANLAPAHVDAILAHELAHIRRHDLLLNALQTIGETLLFYHPAVWWISARVRAEREHCCDDVAVQTCGDAITYAAALTELASATLARPALALAATDGSLVARIRRLLQAAPADRPRAASRVVVVTLAVTLVVVAASVRAITVTQVSGTSAPTTDSGRGFGPPEVNRMLGFELFPMGQDWPTEDPRNARTWGATIRYADGDVPLKGFTARSLIRHAYGLSVIPIVDAPRWLDEESFDLTAVSDSPVALGVADPDGFNRMVRQMLEQHLGLVAHVEQRDFPVYALVTATPDGRLGPGIAPSTADCVGGPRGAAPLVDGLHSGPAEMRPFCGIDNTLTGMRATRVTMAEFVEQIQARDPLAPDLPVVDRTGLSAAYDFRLRFGLLPIAAVGAGHPAFGAVIAPLGFRTLFTALPEQLGLELEKSTAPFDVLVIDEVYRPQS
jgi:uncharacterized protein (TIGR03435 family)